MPSPIGVANGIGNELLIQDYNDVSINQLFIALMGTTLFSMGEWAHNQASFLTNRNVPQMQRNTESAHIYM